MVLAEGQSADAQTAAALEELCRTYWHPLNSYVRRQGYSPEDAQDLTLSFDVVLSRIGGGCFLHAGLPAARMDDASARGGTIVIGSPNRLFPDT